MKRSEKKTSRLGLLAVSFLWALALWFYAAEEMSQKRDLAVRLTVVPSTGRFVHLQEDKGTGEKGPSASVVVWVTVKGPRGKVAGIQAAEIIGRKLLAEDVPSGPLALSLSPSDFSIPNQPDVKVIAVRPSTVSVFVSEAREKPIPVRVIPIGKPAKGYYISDRPKVVPERVEVSAAPEILDKIDFIETEPVDVEGREQSFNIDVRLKKTVSVAGREEEVFIQSDRVIVFMPIDHEPVEVELADVPVGVLLPAGANTQALPLVKTVSLRIRGAETRVAAVTAAVIKFFVDVSREGEVKEAQELLLPVRVIPPEGIDVLPDSYPAMMTVRILP